MAACDSTTFPHPTEIRFYPQRLPSEGDLVMVKVESVATLGANVSLLEYASHDGFLLGSEVARTRLRSIYHHMKPGQIMCCLVVRADHKKGYIDLSKRRVDKDDADGHLVKFSRHKKIHSIILRTAQLLGLANEEQIYDLYHRTAWKSQHREDRDKVNQTCMPGVDGGVGEGRNHSDTGDKNDGDGAAAADDDDDDDNDNDNTDNDGDDEDDNTDDGCGSEDESLDECSNETDYNNKDDKENDDDNDDHKEDALDIFYRCLNDSSVLDQFQLDECTRDVLLQTITTCLHETFVNLKSIVSVCCFGPEGVDAIKTSLKAALELQSEQFPLQISYWKSPMYFLNIRVNSSQKRQAYSNMITAIETIRSKILSFAGGKFEVTEKPKFVDLEPHAKNEEQFLFDFNEARKEPPKEPATLSSSMGVSQDKQVFVGEDSGIGLDLGIQ